MCRTNYSSVTSNPCNHLADYKLRFGPNPYFHLQDRLKPSPNGKTVVRGDEIGTPRCDFCSGYGGRLYSCLLCSIVSCSSSLPDIPNHARSHSEAHPGHEIAVDINRSELYCFACGDQVYDPEFDEIVVSKLLDIMPSRSGRSDGGLMIDGEGLRKRRRVRFELELMGSSSSHHGVGVKRLIDSGRRSKTVHHLGLRGLNNLGNTCFMNSVLQALLHAPPLRNYFLGDRHNRDFCKRKSSSKKNLCLPCDVDGLFSAVFSGDRAPYSPSQFLYSWWLHLDNLANYEQQDAHEFFISILDQIHEKEAKESKVMKDCECIAHRAFSGLLQSDVTCMSCGSTSTTYDPCLDISIDLDTSTSTTTQEDRATSGNKCIESSKISTLSSCLDRFTRPEKLGSNQKLFCEYCQERRNSLKQMSIKHLPLVLCLHIKRFEHSHIRKMSRKINQYLQFPFSLDMGQYLSSTVVRSRYGNRVFALLDDLTEGATTQYEIFAVVTHAGTLDSGHYVTYLRLSDQWYKCDDAWITEVDEGVVRASQCYMIFYVQKMFYYHNQTDKEGATTTRFSRQRKDPFLPIAGCC